MSDNFNDRLHEENSRQNSLVIRMYKLENALQSDRELYREKFETLEKRLSKHKDESISAIGKLTDMIESLKKEIGRLFKLLFGDEKDRLGTLGTIVQIKDWQFRHDKSSLRVINSLSTVFNSVLAAALIFILLGKK